MAQRRSETAEDKDIDSDPEGGFSSSKILRWLWLVCIRLIYSDTLD